MKKFSIFLSLIFATILALSSTACGGSQILNLTAFNTVVRIEAHDKVISSDTKQKLTELFSSLEKEFDKDFNSSITYKLNNGEANANVALSPVQEEVLAKSIEYFEYTEGRFNPAVYPLVNLWGFDNFSLVVDFVQPQKEKIQEILDKNLTDFSQVVLGDNFVYKTNAEIKIDLGGLVKGYAVDKALEIMLSAGHKSGYINVGNSSMALLNVKSLTVSHPRKKGESIISIDTKQDYNITLSTSGDYERYFEDKDGVRYSHIINPNTGYPIQTGIASATALGATGAFTDAITTALCVCKHTPNDLQNSELITLMKKTLQEYPNVQLYIVYEKDGVKQLITNKKQGEDFTLLDNEYKDIVDINLI